MRMIKHIFSGLILILVILVLVFIVRYRQTQLNAVLPPVKVPPPVEVAIVSSGTLPIKENYLGRIQPIHSVALASKVAGYLMEVNGYPGDTINSGEVLIRIDDRPLRKKVAAVEADLLGAKKELLIREKVFQRYTKLLKRNVASEQNYDLYKMDRDLIKSKVDRLKEELADAKIELGYTEIPALFAGIILRRLHEPGDLVQTGEPILEIEDSAKGYKVVLRVPHSVIKNLNIGSTAYLVYDDAVIKAKVTRIFPMVFSTQTLITIEIDLTKRPFGLQSGATVHVDLVVAEPQGIQVPLRALLENHDKHYIFKIVDETRVKTVLVSLLGWTEEIAAVSGSLAVGDKVIVADEAFLLRLGEGTEVLVTKEFSP